MCLLALFFQQLDSAPVAVAANREEFFNRPSRSPAVEPGKPLVICGSDARAGGTWLGVNQHGLLAAVTNRPKQQRPLQPRSRGLLCRELLNHRTAQEAAQSAKAELEAGRYDGANFVMLDSQQAWVIQAGDVLQATQLSPGVHLLANGDLNDAADPRLKLAQERIAAGQWDDVETFIPAAQTLCAYRGEDNRSSIVLRAEDRGTVSSSIIALTTDPKHARYLHAPGPPDLSAYDDYSEQLQEILDRKAV